MGGLPKYKSEVINNSYLKIRNIDVDSYTEGDVETKIISPILTNIFHIPNEIIAAKPYIKSDKTPAFDIDKGNKKKSGYIPDFIAYIEGLPILIIEAKSPAENAEEAIKEASLYALEMNKRYPSDVNPAKYIIGCNGIDFIFGMWDSKEYTKIKVNDINPNNKHIIDIYEYISIEALKSLSVEIQKRINTNYVYYSPINFKGGIKRALSSIEPNPFFGTGILSNIISQYFDSSEENRNIIIEKAYVSTTERNEYDRELEAILNNRIKLFTDNRKEFANNDDVGKALNRYISDNINISQKSAKLQLVIGSVGSGKSLFMERFYQKILSDNLKQKIIWVKIDFNLLPNTLEILEDKVCLMFIDEIRHVAKETHNINIDDNIECIFNGKINENKAIYKKLQKISEKEYIIQLKNDLFEWKKDLHLYTACIAGYLSSMKKNIVIVFDNVDRLETSTQIKLFQIAQWLTQETRSLGIMDIRDTTYEMYKDTPPLDAFATGNNFYINSPSVNQVIYKRLELAANEIRKLTPERKLDAILNNGQSIIYNLEKLELYFTSIYKLISSGHGKRILNSLSNRSIRKVLNVFSQIIKSGHISAEKFIVSAYQQKQHNFEIKVSETELIKALMRENHKYYTPHNNLIHNIWGSIENIEKNCGFIMIECLIFLSKNFNKEGDKRLRGIFACKTIIQHMEKCGFIKNDIMKALKLLLEKDLIYSDKNIAEELTPEDLVQISSSGHLHLHFLSTRLEYLASCAFTAFIKDRLDAERIADIWSIIGNAKDITYNNKKEAANLLIQSIENEYKTYAGENPYFANDAISIQEIIQKAKTGIEWSDKNPPEYYNTDNFNNDKNSSNQINDNIIKI